MQVELGNPSPIVCVMDYGEKLYDADGNLVCQDVTHEHVPHDVGPCVTYVSIPDNYGTGEGTPDQVKLHLAEAMVANKSITHLKDSSAVLVVTHADGVWAHHGGAAPSWVWSDNPALQSFLAAYYGCPAGRPADVEDTHWTTAGAPGVVPGAVLDLEANITQNGRDIVARALGGGQVGTTGQVTGSSTTTLTDSGASWTSNQWAGCRVFATVSGTQMVFGIVVSNTGTALTVDRWYTVETPGGSTGSTPSATGTYVITDGNAPGWFMGISPSTSSISAPSTNTSLPTEIATPGGGLVRQICPYAHTASTNTWTLTPVFTANGTDSLPVTVGSIGVFTSMVVGDTTSTMLFNTLLSPTATLSSSGDQLTITETVTTT